MQAQAQQTRRRKGPAGPAAQAQPQITHGHVGTHTHGTSAPRPAKESRFLFWWRVVFGVAVRITVSVLIVLAGMSLYHAFASWQEDNYFVPPGRMVDVDGHYIHLHCFGGRSDEEGEGEEEEDRLPTVVFDHATMRLSQQFHKVVRSLSSGGGAGSNHTKSNVRVCLVDRAGYGYSDLPSADETTGDIPARTPEVAAEELFKALHRSGEEPPFVLVGHSRGGINQLVYAARHHNVGANNKGDGEEGKEEEEVAGLVLIDPMPPGFRLPKKLQDMKKTVATGLRLVPWLARIGLLRNFMYLTSLTGQADAIYSEDDLAYRRWAECRPSYWHTVLSEFDLGDQEGDENVAIERHEPEIRERQWSLPFVVISAGRLGPTFDDAMREAWLAGMRRLAEYSTRGRLVLAEDSGHDVPSEQPDLVAQAILSVIDQWKETHQQSPSPAPAR